MRYGGRVELVEGVRERCDRRLLLTYVMTILLCSGKAGGQTSRFALKGQ